MSEEMKNTKKMEKDAKDLSEQREKEILS